MISVRRLLSVVVLAAVLVFLSSCHHNPTATQQGPQYIMLTWNGGNCEQNGSAGVIDVYQNQAVIYQGAAAVTEFQVQLSSCPFAAGNCPVNSPNGSPVNVGQPMASAVGSTFMYSGLMMGNQQCNNPGAMGLRVRPAP